MSEHDRRGFLGLSWFQLLAGALAAMTSAWIASALGVAGTIIGAAVGSLVATTTSALYANSLARTRTLIVRTDSGTVVEASAEPGETAVALDAVRDATGSQIQGAEVVDDRASRRIGWKAVVVSTVAILLVAGAAMGGYELLTDRSYGLRTDNAKIGNPFGGSGGDDTDEPAVEPSPSITTPTPTASTPAPTDTPTPTDPTTVPTETPTPSESPSLELP